MNTSKYNWPGTLSIAFAVFMLTACDETELDTGPSENLIFHETFEGPEPFSTVHNKETGDWEYALKYVDSPVYIGSRSGRFEIQHDQPLVADGKRSEVTIIMGTDGQLTRKAWYSFAVYFPSDAFASDTTYDVISQWYKDGSPVRLITKRDRFLIDIGSEIGGKEKIEVGELTLDTWHEFIFHFIHSPYSDGYLAIWHNGKQKVVHSGGNMYNEVLPKWKIGIYKASFEFGTSLVTNRVVFFDNIKVGDENARYRDMEPLRP
ncbi:MAG: polysaccharide lyase [Cyclobacteriaceae bacterium]